MTVNNRSKVDAQMKSLNEKLEEAKLEVSFPKFLCPAVALK